MAYIRPTMSVSTIAPWSIDERVVAAWSRGPQQPALVAGAVHLWRAELSCVEGQVTELLDESERERAARIVDRQKRRSWSRSRGMLRALLGRYLSADPRTLRFAHETHGKPTLAGPYDMCGPPLHFNLSHSRGLALYAFAADGPVGVDVQLMRAPQPQGSGDRIALARRAFGEQRAQHLSALDPGEREREFMRLWTRHEAELKRRGTGLAGVVRTRTEESTAWSVELNVRPDAAAALACAEAPSELHMWEW